MNRNKQRIGQENTVDMQPNSETYGLLGQTNSVIQVDNCSTERKKQVWKVFFRHIYFIEQAVFLSRSL